MLFPQSRITAISPVFQMKEKKKLHRESFSPKELSFCGTDSRGGASLNTIFLNSSNQGSIVCYPPYPHNCYFTFYYLIFESYHTPHYNHFNASLTWVADEPCILYYWGSNQLQIFCDSLLCEKEENRGEGDVSIKGIGDIFLNITHVQLIFLLRKNSTIVIIW